MTQETATNPQAIGDREPIAPSDWEHPSPPTDLIFDDGEPLESNRHRIAMNVLIRSAQQALLPRPDSFVGGNMFVYYSRHQAMNRDFRGPDFFAVLGVEGDRERQGWVIWEEGGRYPDVIIELLSPSTASVDRGVKKDLYEQTFKTPDYFIFDPFDPDSLAGWRLDLTQGYQPLSPNDRGWLWCETLGLWLGTWEGAIDREPMTGTCHWLRFYDPEGNLVPLPEEAAQQQAERERQRAEQESQRAEQERQRADRLAERLRELGIDPSAL
ncbi:Uma2 family endonuclease [Lyngbya sp. CCY1209]|uniref:Uma2 family endonuclease n=1 Tax=Lyngbya sp. CCY1209 TaxID=2886103 RepID=UPI002D2015EC|nr:Uma2 family endonuclease [Lyngbya sp. CCY1209]MEB3884861.1 Uma2 family endonuclease [Lyngbya sp. CCY1209]